MRHSVYIVAIPVYPGQVSHTLKQALEKAMQKELEKARQMMYDEKQLASPCSSLSCAPPAIDDNDNRRKTKWEM